tara:strand:- start:146 stop:319 length:174 start_codon:yes stop_codon:yes gene_type:complete
MFDITLVIQLILMLGACYSCYLSGKEKGIDELIDILIKKRMIDSEQLKKITNKFSNS